MHLNEVKRVLQACISADVPIALEGHRGIGKTEGVRQVAAEWRDPWMKEGQYGIPMFGLYCATQDVPDLIGFPIQVWSSSGQAVVKGIPSTVENDTIDTSWATPQWATQIIKYCAQFDESDEIIRKQMIAENKSKKEIYAFWNRPKAIIFLDELKRAPREVIQAMYPFLIDKQLHMLQMPRGTRVVTADNYAGAYDLREPDEAFMSRLCHIDVEADINTWFEWAVDNDVHSKIRNFLISNPTMLMAIPKDQEEASVKYHANPDPRSWGNMVNRLEKYGRIPLTGSDEEKDHIIKTAIRGIVGLATCEAYWKFSNTDITMEQIITGKCTLKPELNKKQSDIKRNLLKQKLQLECAKTLENRKFTIKEGDALNRFLLELDSKERATAILQTIMIMKNQKKLESAWVKHITSNKQVLDIIQHLRQKDNM